MSIEFLLGLVFAIPLSILGNVLTPKYLDYMAKRSISVKGKRLKTLVKEYQSLKKLAKNPTQLAVDMYFEIVRSITLLAIIGLLILCTSLFSQSYAIPQDESASPLSVKDLLSVMNVLIVTLFGGTVLTLMNLGTKTLNLVRFHDYESSVLLQIEKLGGNVNELLGEEPEKTK